jgi:hypothetical protein
MKHRFLLHSLSHTFVVVDITDLGLPNEIYPRDGKRQMVPSLRFQSWNDAKRDLTKLGAAPETLEAIHEQLKATGVAVLTII